MELVSVLPSAEDEVNVACFHPLAGVGLFYGTKVCTLSNKKNFSLYFYFYYLFLVVGRKT